MSKKINFNAIKEKLPIALAVGVCLVSICLFFVVVRYMTVFEANITATAKDYTTVLASDYKQLIVERLEELSKNSEALSNDLSVDSASSTAMTFSNNKPYIKCIGFFKGNDRYMLYGNYDFFNKPIAANRGTTTPKFEGEQLLFTYREDVNGGSMLFCLDYAQMLNADNQISYSPELICVTNAIGDVVWQYNKADSSKVSNISTYLKGTASKTTDFTEIDKGIAGRKSNAYEMTIKGNQFVFTVAELDAFGEGYRLTVLYNRDAVMTNGGEYINGLLGASVGLTAITLAMLIAIIVVNTKTRRATKESKNTDPILKCNTFDKFRREAIELMAQNKNEKYAIVALNINKYKHIREKFDSSSINDLLRFIAKIIHGTIINGESYGHISDDTFVMLMYCGDEQNFRNRIITLRSLINNYEPLRDLAYTIYFNIGAFLVEDGKGLEINDMLDRAVVAQLNNEKHPTEPYIIYDNDIRAAYSREAEIESRMENALKNSDFKVFFQPKYNIKNDRIDSAEALVRWHDPVTNKYTPPDAYIPLFEVNGFIVRLDYYVYDRVCDYLADATARGEKVVPISVNVSRVTAMTPGFIDHYIKKKTKCGIPNGFIYIEFTESFAFDNYEVMKAIVKQLKANGFLCSIDDYGSGHSSQKILKELPMDELKLDRFFISKTEDNFKDDTLLAMTINLGTAFNLKVVQEGVETYEDLQRLKKCECDVIQGYYYSKPLMMSDFIDFVNGDTSLKNIRLLYEDGQKFNAYK